MILYICRYCISEGCILSFHQHHNDKQTGTAWNGNVSGKQNECFALAIWVHGLEPMAWIEDDGPQK